LNPKPKQQYSSWDLLAAENPPWHCTWLLAAGVSLPMMLVLLTAANESVEAYGLREFFAITNETILHSGLSALGPLMDGQATDSALKVRLHPQDIFPQR